MKPKELTVKAALQIQKPAHEVFEAIIDPVQMSSYFISQGSARMEEGRTVVWRFPEFDFDAPVHIAKIEKDKYISFFWDGENGRELFVEMWLEETPATSTVVRISEGKMENDEAGIRWLTGNTEGWANFLACLKAWLEYGINLRKGAFDFMKENDPFSEKNK